MLMRLRRTRTDDVVVGDTKAGTLIGTDRFGNRYFEDNEELPLRTRWVDYKEHFYDAYVLNYAKPKETLCRLRAQIEPGWHAWISYAVDKPPTEDALIRYQRRAWEDKDAKTIQNYTQTRGAYKPYSTVKSKITTWEPFAATRK
ncbi:hypothetical protein SLS62_010867 [Diatrype stigma]|uniref:NADH dehydrogenase [ubiquinone] 1 alpha subcomplex subunit n=1 Tax=Diatrype stigma TaxID=117547 RepID=A0AAN9U7T7_9PEZI